MTKEAAQKAFFNTFGIPFYAHTEVPAEASMPYGTYTPAYGSFGDPPFAVTVNLWYRAEGESEPNAKAREISERLGRSGVFVPCDGGGIWFVRGTPWCNAVVDPDDSSIKRRVINILAECQTTN